MSKEATALYKLLVKNDFQFDDDFMKWKLRPAKEILKSNKDHCYGTSYLAYRTIPGAKRLYIIETRRLLNEKDRKSLAAKRIPKDLFSPNSNTHALTYFTVGNSFYWFEYSFGKYAGIHKYKSFDEMANDIVKKWRKSGVCRFKHGIVTNLSITKIGINLVQFTKIGCLSKIIREY